MKTGILIKELRLKKGLTQEELAHKTELSTRTIQRIESGAVDPRAYTLQMIANALDVDFAMFVEDESDENQENSKSEANNVLALFHLTGLLPIFFPSIILWKLKKDKSKDSHIHFRAVILLQFAILGITLIGCAIYWKMNQSIPLFGGLAAGALLSIMNTMRVLNGDSFVSPFIKNAPKEELNN